MADTHNYNNAYRDIYSCFFTLSLTRLDSLINNNRISIEDEDVNRRERENLDYLIDKEMAFVFTYIIKGHKEGIDEATLLLKKYCKNKVFGFT